MGYNSKIDLKNISLDIFSKKFDKHLKTFSKLKVNDKVLIAVSGGMDSMALFALCNSLDQFNIAMGHINHCLRNDSEKDLDFVKSIAETSGIPFYFRNLNPAQISDGESIESWARKNRYKKLNHIASEVGAKWIMTAHHGNDQAETVLLNLSRHSGISGLRGIGKQNHNLLRPLLPFSKKQLKNFVLRMNIPFISDPTNDNLNIPRNFLRKKILKLWIDFDPHLVRAIRQSVDHFSEWKDALDHFILNGFIDKVQRVENKFIIPLTLIKENPLISIIRLLQFLVSDNENLWSKHEIDQVRMFLKNNKIGRTLQVKNGWILLRNRSEIIGKNKLNPCYKKFLKIQLDRSVIFRDYFYKISLTNQISFDKEKVNTEYVNWSILKTAKLEVRLWNSGDLFQPLGMSGHQKVSDFLINEKVDRFAKENQTVMTANERIFWICGHRIADWVKITKTTKEKAKLNFRRVK